MALVEHTMLGKVDKVQQAITRIKSFDPLTTGMMDTPYYVAYSGGKHAPKKSAWKRRVVDT